MNARGRPLLHICSDNHPQKDKLRRTPLWFKRVERGLTMEELEEASGIRFTRISRYELGFSLPRVDAAIALARALETTVEELFSGVI